MLLCIFIYFTGHLDNMVSINCSELATNCSEINGKFVLLNSSLRQQIEMFAVIMMERFAGLTGNLANGINVQNVN